MAESQDPASRGGGDRVHWVAVFLAVVVFCILFLPVWAFAALVVFVVADRFGTGVADVNWWLQISAILTFVTTMVVAWGAYRFFKWQRKQRPECLDCGYNLTGNVSGVCPECGTAVHMAPRPPMKGEIEDEDRGD